VAVNAELFSRDKQNVPMLLSLLEEPPTGVDDFHCRYQALQILTGLSSSLHRLQEVRRRDAQLLEGHMKFLQPDCRKRSTDAATMQCGFGIPHWVLIGPKTLHKSPFANSHGRLRAGSAGVPDGGGAADGHDGGAGGGAE
jgi:hypothetical protein